MNKVTAFVLIVFAGLMVGNDAFARGNNRNGDDCLQGINWPRCNGGRATERIPTQVNRPIPVNNRGNNSGRPTVVNNYYGRGGHQGGYRGGYQQSHYNGHHGGHYNNGRVPSSVRDRALIGAFVGGLMGSYIGSYQNQYPQQYPGGYPGNGYPNYPQGGNIQINPNPGGYPGNGYPNYPQGGNIQINPIGVFNGQPIYQCPGGGFGTEQMCRNNQASPQPPQGMQPVNGGYPGGYPGGPQMGCQQVNGYMICPR